MKNPETKNEITSDINLTPDDVLEDTNETETQSENLYCFDERGYEATCSGFYNSVYVINLEIEKYERIFGRKITETDFENLINKNINPLKESYGKVLAERLSQIQSPTLKAMDEEAYMKDGRKFFMALTAVRIEQNGKHFHTGRIRLENGKAVFNSADQKKLLEEKFSVNIGSPEYRGLFFRLNRLTNAYHELYMHLYNNKEALKIDPTHESIINDRGILYLDTVDDNKLKVNMQRLTDRF